MRNQVLNNYLDLLDLIQTKAATQLSIAREKHQFVTHSNEGIKREYAQEQMNHHSLNFHNKIKV